MSLVTVLAVRKVISIARNIHIMGRREDPPEPTVIFTPEASEETVLAAWSPTGILLRLPPVAWSLRRHIDVDAGELLGGDGEVEHGEPGPAVLGRMNDSVKPAWAISRYASRPASAGRDPGRAGQPVRDSLTRGPCKGADR
jgi:hypothetical protein